MAYNADHGVNLGVLKNSLTRAKTEWLAAISKSRHAQYKKVDAVPEPDAAQENVLYLVKNTGTNHYDIYAKIDGAMELLDDTTVSLDDYVTEEALAEALAGVGGGALYEGTKTDLEAADSIYRAQRDVPQSRGRLCCYYHCQRGDLRTVGLPVHRHRLGGHDRGRGRGQGYDA